MSKKPAKIYNSSELLESPEKPLKRTISGRSSTSSGRSNSSLKQQGMMSSDDLLASPPRQKKIILSSSDLLASPERPVSRRTVVPPKKRLPEKMPRNMVQSPVQKKKKILSSDDLLASPPKQPVKTNVIQRKKMDINLSFKELTERNKDTASQSSQNSQEEKAPIEGLVYHVPHDSILINMKTRKSDDCKSQKTRSSF